MYIVQIKHQTETWIVAICQFKEDATEYLSTLSAEIQADAILYEIAIEYYPFILIENTLTPPDSDIYFEFCDFEELQSRLDMLRGQKAEPQDHVYFKYYYISEPYGQMVTDDNFMKYLRHTTVTNDILQQTYPVSFFHEEIKKNVANYDLDRLDQLFEHTKTRFTSALEKEDLALNGYNSLFWEMNYDHACGKLTDAGMSYLLPMVENMEILLGEKKWQHRSYAQHILLQQACKEHPETAKPILQNTLDVFDKYLISNPEEKLEIHRLLCIAYRWMMEAAPADAFKYWQLAISEINKAIDHSPEKASWSSLLELLHMTTEDQKISETQVNFQKGLQTKAEELERQLGTAIAYPIAVAYQHIREYLEWNNTVNNFPASTAMQWAEKAIAYNPTSITRIDLHECADFFNRIGSQTKRIDFLAKSISLHELVIKSTSDCAMEIYYIASIWQQIAKIHLTNNERPLADEAILQAQSIYKKNFAIIKTNRSSYLHYAEFLEYCYTYEGYIIKPSLSELKYVANEIEAECEGFMSYPYILLMRIALFEKNEKKAIAEGTKSLILHELCADSTFNVLHEEFSNTGFSEFNHFLKETKSFMEEVSTNYYYNPHIKWKNLQTMPPDEILAYWEKRKEEIRNRLPHTIE